MTQRVGRQGAITTQVLVFDFDGVILDSATLKRKAFAALYDNEPLTKRRAVRAYLNRKGGQPREVKFRHIESHILGRDANTKHIQELCRQFKADIEARILDAPAIPGAIEFLQRWTGRCPLYLLSATPQKELQDIVAKRSLDTLFDEMIGAPPDKVTALRNLLSRRHLPAGDTVMVGDSYNDYRAARSNGTHFVGITADPDESPFPADVLKIVDLNDLEGALSELIGP